MSKSRTKPLGKCLLEKQNLYTTFTQMLYNKSYKDVWQAAMLTEATMTNLPTFILSNRPALVTQQTSNCAFEATLPKGKRSKIIRAWKDTVSLLLTVKYLDCEHASITASLSKDVFSLPFSATSLRD